MTPDAQELMNPEAESPLGSPLETPDAENVALLHLERDADANCNSADGHRDGGSSAPSSPSLGPREIDV